MKIAHLLGWYFPDSIGGTEVYVEALCRRLRAAGHQVRIAAPDSHGAAPERYEHDGVQVFRYAISNAPTRDEAYHRVAVRGAERLHRWLDDERPDVLHVHSFTTGVGLPEIRAAHRLGIRVIVTCHLPGFGYMCRTGELMQWGRYPCDGIVEPAKCASCNLTRLGLAQPVSVAVGALPIPLSRLLRHIPGRIGTTLGMSESVVEYEGMQRELFGLVDRFVVLNETARRMLTANGSPAHKIVLNRLGLSQTAPPKLSPDVAPTQRPVRLGFLGRLHPSKGLTELARAVAATPRAVDFRLEIRGPALDPFSRQYADQLRGLVADDSRVSFEPAVAPSEVPAVLTRLDALLIPSMWFENGPTIALEAMAVGTPIIASRVGNLAEIIDDGVNGRLVTAGDVAGFVRALTESAVDPARSIDVWRRGITPPRTMDEVTRDYLSLYDRVVDSRHAIA
ncbi:MAG: glycosyltransferase [Vicinamibacterales bacterium]